jgi:penicillin-binding protein 1A
MARLIARVVRWFVYGMVASAVLWAGLFWLLAPALPDAASLRRAQKSPGITVVAADGSVLDQRGAFNGAFVSLNALPRYLPQAVIATEDRRFYKHFGVDVFGFARALLANLRAGRVVQGGSTITQQLAKNLYLTPERTILRKLREMMLAVWLETRLSKNEILALYLNRVYLGAGAYGVEAAARKYFGKPVRRVSLAEAALLTGLLKAPTRYAPTNNLARSHARAGQVLENMVEAGYLAPAQAAAARRAPANPVRQPPSARRARYFVDWVLETLPAEAQYSRDNLVVFTTLDPRMQRIAEAVVEKVLRIRGPRRKVTQAALIAFDRRGAVRAMVGGRAYAKSQFNRAVQARRQPGSAFKPFVYLTAIESGLTPRTMVRDSPVVVEGWRPKNLNGRYRGAVPLKLALAQSINSIAVKLTEHVGREEVVATARRLGIRSKLTRHPSLALGTSELSLYELTAAYIPFANAGREVSPFAVFEIRTRGGGSVYRRGMASQDRIIDPKHLGQMNEMLAEVLRSGTGKAARLPRRPAAGKTGTTQDYRDGWFIGYTSNLVTGVWLGNDDNTPMRGVSGGRLPARIWRDFMLAASQYAPMRDLPEGGEEEGVPVAVLFDRIAAWFRDLAGPTHSGAPRQERSVEEMAQKVEDWFLRHAPGGSGQTNFPEDEAE